MGLQMTSLPRGRRAPWRWLIVLLVLVVAGPTWFVAVR